MPETTNNFRNIISVVAEANTAQTALADILRQIQAIQVTARDAGGSLNALFAAQQKMGGQGYGGAQRAEDIAWENRGMWQGKQGNQPFRDITMGGLEVGGAGSGRDSPAIIAGRERMAAAYAETRAKAVARFGEEETARRERNMGYSPPAAATPGAGGGARPGYYEQLAKDKSANEATLAQMQADISARSASKAATFYQGQPQQSSGMTPEIAAQIKAAIQQPGGGAYGGAALGGVLDETKWSRMSYQSMTTQPRAAQVPFREQLPQMQLGQEDLAKMREAKQIGEGEYAAYERQAGAFKAQQAAQIAALKERAAAAKVESETIQMTLQAETQLASLRKSTAGAMGRKGIGEEIDITAAAGAASRQAMLDANKQIQLQSTLAGRTSLPVSNWTDPKEIDKLAQGLNRVENAAGGAGRGFGSMAGHIIGGMFVWQGVNMAVNALSQTFETVKKNYLAVDDAAAKLSVTMGIGKASAEAYAMSMVAAGAQYGIGTQESLAAASFGARVQKEPGKRQELFDVSAQLAIRTGEDQLKLMDNINVASRQSGLSYTQVGDMAEAAYNKTGTSATQAGDIIRELGPIAQSSGVDINTLFETVIKSADRMGGSASDATNTWTRLWKAVTEPNKAQIDVLNKYQIPLSADVNTKMSQITKAGLTPEEMGVMSGRPGMPAAANDMRTMFEVMKTLDGELSRGPKLADDYAKSVDSLDFSFKKFFAGIQAGMGLTVGVLEKGLSGKFNQADLMRMYGYDEATIAKVQGKFADFQSDQGRKNRQAAGQLYRDATGAQVQPAISPPTTPTAPWSAESDIRNLIESKLVNMPTSPTDLTKYTGAELGGIGGQGKKQEQAWIESLDKFYTSMKIDPKKKEELLAEAQQSIDTFIAVFKTPQGISVEYGAEAFYKQQNLQQQGELLGAAPNTGTDISQYTDAEVKAAMSQTSAIAQNWMNSWREFYEAQGLDQSQIDSLMAAKQEGVDKTIAAVQSGPNSTIVTGQTAAYLPQALQQASRQQTLEERLKELRESLSELNETTKKAQKMEGLWNIPVGARILAPFAGKEVEPEGPDTSDESRKQKQREKIEEDISKTQAELDRITNADAVKQLPAAQDVGLAPKIQVPREDPRQPMRDREARLEKQELEYENRPLSTAGAALDVQGFNTAVGRWAGIMGSGKAPTFDKGKEPFAGLGQLSSPAKLESVIPVFSDSVTTFGSAVPSFKEGVSSFFSSVGMLSSAINPMGTYVGTFGSAVDRLLIGIGNIMQNAPGQPTTGGPSASSGVPTYHAMTNDLINQARIQGVLSQ